MKPSEIFVRKPVLTTLLSLCLLLVGLEGYRSLPVSNLPNVQFPYIVISALYPGNSPVSMAANVARPIEEAVLSIEGLQEVKSTSQEGVVSVVLTFRVGEPMATIVEGVQTALSQAAVQLPSDLPMQPTFQKINPSLMPVYFIALTSNELDDAQLYTVGAQALSRKLNNVPGVGNVIIFGAKPAVRIQADPGKLFAKGISLEQLQQAVIAANSTIPAGNLNGANHTFSIDAEGQLQSAAEFNQVIVANVAGAPVRVADVGRAIDGLQQSNLTLAYRATGGAGRSAVILAVQKQGTANTVTVANDIAAALKDVGATLPGTVQLSVLYDASRPIITSINDVKEALVIAFVLVILVIFVFLARVRETIIPAVALPMSVLATFGMMAACGFSLDMLSMLGLTLAVGFVVDDAIVVLENAVRQIELGKQPFEAAIDSVHEISPTVISMTLSLCAVFIPLIFMPGLIGKILQEFSLTIVFSILASGVISLTLSPMMCSRLLRPKSGGPNRLERVVGAAFTATVGRYETALEWFLRHRWLAIVASIGCVVGTLALFVIVPKSFIPAGDTGAINGTLTLQPGVSPARRASIQSEAVDLIAKHAAVGRVLAYSGTTQSADNQISLLIILKPGGTRPPSAVVSAELNRALADLPGIQGGVNPMPMISLGTGSSGGGGEGSKRYSYQITGPELERVYDSAASFVAVLQKTPGFSDPRADLDRDHPQLTVHLLRDTAKTLGVDPAAIGRTLFLAYSGNKITTINTTTDQYYVILEVAPDKRMTPSDLGRLYVTGAGGRLVPLAAVATWEESLGPGQIQHEGLMNMVPITFALKPGFSLGEATAAISRLKATDLPAGVNGDFSGEAKMFVQLGEALLFLVVLAIFCMYLVLGILYEDYWNPLTVLSSLPLAGFGGLLTLLICHVDFGLYAFVGLFLLLGIVKKNGIMMVDFAKQHRDRERCSPEIAVLEASRERFRPIMMTTLAAVMGALPIALGIGASGKDYQSLGLTIAGGLLFSQLITLFVTPCIYVYVEELRDWLNRKLGRAASADSALAQNNQPQSG